MSTTAEKVEEYRPEGSRNFIRVGDIVKVKLGKKHPVLSRLSEIEKYPNGTYHFTVIFWAKANGTDHSNKYRWRIVGEDEISRVDQKRWAHLRSDFEEEA